MALFGIVVQIAAVVTLLLVVAAVGLLGPERLGRTARTLRPRLRAVAVPATVLGLTLAINSILRDGIADLSWRVGVNMTGIIYEIEGGFVPWLQAYAAPPLTAYFSFMYVYGYAFLLVFPVIAYLSLSDSRPLRTLLIAYVVNYAIGLVCYLLVIAYGPRNLLPDLVDSLLYNTYPQFQLLTAEVNTNTNVFPSLHSSLAVTVAILAAGTRERLERWYPVAVTIALSICVSTMYLGIHWAIDVVGGVALAYVAVSVASMERWH